MWRDILIILGFALSALGYFGLTPRRIFRYTRTIKGKVVNRRLYQRIILSFVVLNSLYCIYHIIYKFDELSLDVILFVLSSSILLWIITLRQVCELSETGNKIITIVYFSVFLPLFVSAIVFADMPLWQKLTYPIGGFLIGFGIRQLESYLKRKFKRIS